jgi:hypothetical protein
MGKFGRFPKLPSLSMRLLTIVWFNLMVLERPIVTNLARF